MSGPIKLREDYDAGSLRALAKTAARAEVRQRLLGMAAIYDGASRTAAAEVAGIGRQVLRDWVIRFNTEGPDGLNDSAKKGGGGNTLSKDHKAVLEDIIYRGRCGSSRASLQEMMTELKINTGRTVCLRSLSLHVARISGRSVDGPSSAGPSENPTHF